MNRETELYTMSNEELEEELKKMDKQLWGCMSNQWLEYQTIQKNIDIIREVQRIRAIDKSNQ